MKRRILLLLVIVVIFFSACDSKSPKAKGKEFMKAMKNVNIEKMKSLCPEVNHAQIDEYVKAINLIKEKKGYKFSYAVDKVSTEGNLAEFKAKTKIKFCEKVMKNTVTLYLEKKDEQWGIVDIE